MRIGQMISSVARKVQWANFGEKDWDSCDISCGQQSDYSRELSMRSHSSIDSGRRDRRQTHGSRDILCSSFESVATLFYLCPETNVIRGLNPQIRSPLVVSLLSLYGVVANSTRVSSNFHWSFLDTEWRRYS